MGSLGTSQLRLRVPDARQGPGPMPPALVDALAPAVARLVARTLPGVNRASGVGVGTELAQLRPYELGDDVRHIDASASARTATLHVRLHVPERARTTWIVLDLSPSMAFGTEGRLKADVAEGVALVFGRLGVRQAGSVGVVAWGAGPVRPGPASVASEPDLVVLAPRGSKPGLVALRRLLSAGVAPDGTGDPRALSAALTRTLGLARQPGLVVVISDLRDQADWSRPLGALALRHSVVVVEVSDPREQTLPAAGRLSLLDPESGRFITVDTHDRGLRTRFAAREAARRAEVHRELRRLAVHHIPLSTAGPWLRDLGRGLS